MHVFVGFSALAFCTIFAFSLADIFLDDDIVPAESLSPESNLGFNNNDVKDVGDSTLTFNDFVYPADSDIDFMASSAACGGGNGNLNKLRLRQNGATSCDTQEKGGAIVPEVFQSNEPILDRLGALSKTGGRRCIWRPYITNCCCNGIVGLIYSMGPPMVHVDIPDCYVNLGDAPCLTTYDACCQWYDAVTRDGYMCYTLGYSVDGHYFVDQDASWTPSNNQLPPGQP